MKNIDNYRGTFLRKKFIYDGYLKRKFSYDSVVDKTHPNNQYIIKDALQNYHKHGIFMGYKLLCSHIERIEQELFKWLNSNDRPYYYIYYSDYEYNTFNCIYRFYHVEGTGINKFSHYLARQYAMSKL